MTDPDPDDANTGPDDASSRPDVGAGLDGLRAALDEVDALLLDAYQSGFPVREEPFAAIADDLDVAATTVLERLRAHEESGLVRRVGPVLDPAQFGSSALAALRVPADEFDDVTDVVNGYTQVSHNYRRDHAWNMWFVLTARSRDRRDAVLSEIGNRTGLDPLVLPKRETYCLDLQFPVVADRARRGRDRSDRDVPDAAGADGTPASGETGRALSSVETAVVDEIQDGVPLSLTPYADVAAELGIDVATVVSAVRRLVATGHVKRVGVVVDHHAAGFRDNCMVVWKVPDDELDEVGEAAGGHPYVTKCYHRPRRPDRGWHYTLFTMIHGRDATAVDEWIAELAADYVPYPHERLETVERLKQTGTRYDALLPDGDL